MWSRLVCSRAGGSIDALPGARRHLQAARAAEVRPRDAVAGESVAASAHGSRGTTAPPPPPVPPGPPMAPPHRPVAMLHTAAGAAPLHASVGARRDLGLSGQHAGCCQCCPAACINRRSRWGRCAPRYAAGSYRSMTPTHVSSVTSACACDRVNPVLMLLLRVCFVHVLVSLRSRVSALASRTHVCICASLCSEIEELAEGCAVQLPC